ncbi:MAG: methyltransferase domain-containing protein [Candidatus Omnitrophica bacterium]|nr:methyltransferase domain-containing protein [Candidatus Omnitrophota bacterium]
MKIVNHPSLSQIQDVYSGPEGDLWELIMGEQIHIGGFASSMKLAENAGICEGMKGLDLCCCSGAGMRFLARFKNVLSMKGVDATEKVIARGIERNQKEGFKEKIDFVLAEATHTGLPSEQADFVWGEDAWCYVENKKKLIEEAVRLVKPSGIIAFTDWVKGPKAIQENELKRFNKFMKFPNILDIQGYKNLFEDNGCSIIMAQDTGEFASHVDLYLDMLNKQLTYDALKIINFDMDLLNGMAGEMVFMQSLAREGKIAQGMFIAKKK